MASITAPLCRTFPAMIRLTLRGEVKCSGEISRIAGLILPCCIPLQTGNSSNNHRRLNRRPDFLPGPRHFWDLCFPSSSPCLSFADHSKGTLASEYTWHSIKPSKLRDEGKPLRCTTLCTREAAVKGRTWRNSRVENRLRNEDTAIGFE